MDSSEEQLTPRWYRRTFTIRAALAGMALLCAAFAVIGWARTSRPIERRIAAIGGQAEPMGLGDDVSPVLYYPERIFGPLRRFHEIRSVHVQSDEYTDEDFASTCALGTVTSLTVKSVAITDDGLKALSQCPKLEALRLIAPVGDRGLGVVNELRSLRTLEVTSDLATGEFLVGSQGTGNILQTLKLSGRKVDDRVLVHIEEFPYLSEVKLSDTAVTDDGLMQLIGLDYLSMVDVRRTMVTAEGVARFREYAPGINVKW
jgi:hypothetical protein